MEFLTNNWEWCLIALMIAEKIDSKDIHPDNYEISIDKLREMKNERALQ